MKWKRILTAAVIVCLLAAVVFLESRLQIERREADAPRAEFESHLAMEIDSHFFSDYEQFAARSDSGDVLREITDRVYDHLQIYSWYFEELETPGWWPGYSEELETSEGQLESDVGVSIQYCWNSIFYYAQNTMVAYSYLVDAQARGAPEEDIKACFENLQPYFDILFRWDRIGDDGAYAESPGLAERFQQFQQLIKEDFDRWDEGCDQARELWNKKGFIETVSSQGDLQMPPEEYISSDSDLQQTPQGNKER